MKISTRLEKLERIAGILIFAFFVAMQMAAMPKWHPQQWMELAHWFLVTLLFCLFLFAYLRRPAAIGSASGWQEILLPIVCAGLPLAALGIRSYLSMMLKYGEINLFPLMQPLLQEVHEPQVFKGLLLMTLGEAITVGGMVSLGKCFSIMSEARGLVKKGLYRYIRHPLYTGEILSVMGGVCVWPTIWSIILGFLFTILQPYRAWIEEQKLMSVFPEYQSYRQETGFLLPRLFRRFKKS